MDDVARLVWMVAAVVIGWIAGRLTAPGPLFFCPRCRELAGDAWQLGRHLDGCRKERPPGG